MCVNLLPFDENWHSRSGLHTALNIIEVEMNREGSI